MGFIILRSAAFQLFVVTLSIIVQSVDCNEMDSSEYINLVSRKTFINSTHIELGFTSLEYLEQCPSSWSNYNYTVSSVDADTRRSYTMKSEVLNFPKSAFGYRRCNRSSHKLATEVHAINTRTNQHCARFEHIREIQSKISDETSSICIEEGTSYSLDIPFRQMCPTAESVCLPLDAIWSKYPGSEEDCHCGMFPPHSSTALTFKACDCIACNPSTTYEVDLIGDQLYFYNLTHPIVILVVADRIANMGNDVALVRTIISSTKVVIIGNKTTEECACIKTKAMGDFRMATNTEAMSEVNVSLNCKAGSEPNILITNLFVEAICTRTNCMSVKENFNKSCSEEEKMIKLSGLIPGIKYKLLLTWKFSSATSSSCVLIDDNQFIMTDNEGLMNLLWMILLVAVLIVVSLIIIGYRWRRNGPNRDQLHQNDHHDENGARIENQLDITFTNMRVTAV